MLNFKVIFIVMTKENIFDIFDPISISGLGDGICSFSQAGSIILRKPRKLPINEQSSLLEMFTSSSRRRCCCVLK